MKPEKFEPATRDPTDSLQKFVDELLSTRHGACVLEAGCGSTSHLGISGFSKVVGIDISEMQLERNDYLDDKLLGDIQTYNLPKNAFDLIVCWDVLEHLPRPEDALANMGNSLRKGGLMIIAAPNLLSLKGIVTKLTPYAAHKWFYHRIIGDKRRAAEGFNQFATYLRRSMTPRGVRRFARSKGFACRFYWLTRVPCSGMFGATQEPRIQFLRSWRSSVLCSHLAAGIPV